MEQSPKEAATRTPCPPRVIELVERFRENKESYHSGAYDEAKLRREFLDPFFAELGWDMENASGVAEAYKEVIYENRARLGVKTDVHDYLFRIGGTPKFLVEAKKPAVNLLDSSDAASQLRRYGWNRKLPLCILTNFESFVTYDTRVPPRENDPASMARTLVVNFEDYARRWDEIAGVFSKESILKGRFDKEAGRKDRRGTEEVDDSILSEIEGWRAELATNIKLRNQSLNQQELNFSVQATIDRIVFLRISEDRGVEAPRRLLACARNPGVYGRLLELFRQADDRYNSGLFHFQAEHGRMSKEDSLTPGLAIDDAVLKDVVGRLYPPASIYDFSVIPVEVLGQVYEQFLGKVIVVTEKRARVEEKPEVRKSGGVYYTPSYIVDSIVRKTLGPLLAGKTPDEVARLKIVDPACGSGSFLLRAYQALLDWHLEQYERNPRRWKDRVSQTGPTTYSLVSHERTRILLNNIFGVDIDPQAVEVTKLSLLLKVLEKTPGEVIDLQLKLTRERALPDLDSNIKCGNSLLDYRQIGQVLLDEESRRRVNPFDWRSEFPTVIGQGGFDAVIGNPPYIRVQVMKEWAPLEVELYKRQYQAARKGNYDVYVCFIERGLELLNSAGRLGFIVPHKFFNAVYGGPIRELIASDSHLAEVVHFGDQQVFPDATTYTCLLFLTKASSPECKVTRVADLTEWVLRGASTEGTIPSSRIDAGAWNFTVGPGAPLLERLTATGLPLGKVAEIFVGLQTSADDVYILDLVKHSRGLVTLKSKALGRDVELEENYVHPLVSGTDVKRYAPLTERQFIVFPYEVDPNVAIVPLRTIGELAPLTAAYLCENRRRLEDREKGRSKGKDWHGYLYLKNMRRQHLPKICVPRLVERLGATIDATGVFFLDNVDVNGIVWRDQFDQHSVLYLLALLNSRLLDWHFQQVSAPFRGGYRSANKQFLSPLSIRTIDFSNDRDRAAHDELVALASGRMRLEKELAAARTDPDRRLIVRQITATDQSVDQLVYSLYGLSQGEIRLIESGRA